MAFSILDLNGNLKLTLTGVSVASGKVLTVSNSFTLTAVDGSTLAIGSGGTLGTAAYTASSAYAQLGAANSFTLINPLTTISESWIGPSSTTGLYFKGGISAFIGSVSIGKTTNNYPIDVDPLVGVSAGAINTGGEGNLNVAFSAGNAQLGQASTTGNAVVAAAKSSGHLIFTYWNGSQNVETARLKGGTGSLILKFPATLMGYTVAGLPAGVQGYVAYCTDLLAPTFMANAVGGGAIVGVVFYNGANWVSF
jgi:hypothetical protein